MLVPVNSKDPEWLSDQMEIASSHFSDYMRYGCVEVVPVKRLVSGWPLREDMMSENGCWCG